MTELILGVLIGLLVGTVVTIVIHKARQRRASRVTFKDPYTSENEAVFRTVGDSNFQPTTLSIEKTIAAVRQSEKSNRRSQTMGDDPRTDRHPDDGVPGKYPTPPGEPQEAPGGAGTGDKNSPEKEPAAQPGQRPAPPSRR